MINFTFSSARGAAGSSTSLATALRSNAALTGSIGVSDPFFDKTVLARVSNGVTKWAVSSDLTNWTPYTPPFTVKSPPQYGNRPAIYNQPSDNLFASPPSLVIPDNERYFIAADSAGTRAVAVKYFNIPIVIKYSTDGGVTWSNSDTSAFSALNSPFNYYGVFYGNGRFLIIVDVDPGRGVYSSTDGISWTYQGVVDASATYGNDQPQTFGLNTYFLTRGGSRVNVYSGSGTSVTTLIDDGQVSFGIRAAVNTTNSNEVLFWVNGGKYYLYSGTGSTATLIANIPGMTVLAMTWDRFAGKYMAVLQNDLGVRFLSVLNGTTWQTVSTLDTEGASSTTVKNLIVPAANTYVIVGKISNTEKSYFFSYDANLTQWVRSSENYFTSGMTGIEYLKVLNTDNDMLFGTAEGLYRGRISSSKMEDYRAWRHVTYNAVSTSLDVMTSKNGLTTWVSGNGSTIANTIGNTSSLPFRTYKFSDFGTNAYLAAPVSNVGSTDTGPLVLKTTDGGTTWQKSLDLRNSVTGVLITEPGAYTLPPTVTITHPTTGNVATFSVTLGNVTQKTCTITNPGSGYRYAATAFTGGIADPIHSASPEGKVILDRNGSVTSIQIIKQGLDYTTAPTVSISGAGGSGAAATLGLNPEPGIVRINITNPGTGYPQGRYNLTITKDPADPAAGGGAAIAEVGTPNVIFSEICGRGDSDSTLVLAPSGLIQGNYGLSSSTYYVSTDQGATWNAQRLPRTSLTEPNPAHRGNGSAWTYRIIRGVDFAYTGGYGPVFFFYGSDVLASNLLTFRPFFSAANVVNATTTITPSGHPSITTIQPMTTHVTGAESYSGAVSMANNSNATSNATAHLIIVHNTNIANNVTRSFVYRGTAASLASFTTNTSLSNVATLWNRIEFSQSNQTWVAYGADGRVATSPDGTTWTFNTNPGSLF